MIETDQFSVTTRISLYERHWSVESPVGNIVIIHGFGEHCTRYDHIASRLNAEGYSVYSYDHRGHGHSPGKMGHVASFNDLIDDLDCYLTHLSTRLGDLPLFLFGHSMGGLVLASYAEQYEPEVNGLIFSSAGIKASDDLAPFMQKVSGILSVLLPWLPALALDPNTISRKPEEVDMYVHDPLVFHGKINARTGHQMLTTMKEAEANLSKITQPFIALHGTDDKLVDCESSQILYDKAGSKDKTLKMFDGGYHEVFNDLQKEEFLSTVIEWIKKRT